MQQSTLAGPPRSAFGPCASAFALVGDHVEMRVVSSPTGLPDSGFGMLKSRRAALPAGLDPATLLKR